MSAQPEVMEVVDNRKRVIDEPADLVTLAEVERVYEDWHPRRQYVLIRQNAPETIYAGTRFIIPDSAQQGPDVGVVVSVGVDIDPVKDCKPGDLALFNSYSAQETNIDGEIFQLSHIEDVRLVRAVTYAIGK